MPILWSGAPLGFLVASVSFRYWVGRGVRVGGVFLSFGALVLANSTTEILPSVTMVSPVAFERFLGAVGRSTSAYEVAEPMNNKSVSTQSRSRSMCGSMRWDHLVPARSLVVAMS